MKQKTIQVKNHGTLMDDADEHARDVEISAAGRTWAARWDELERRLAAFTC